MKELIPLKLEPERVNMRGKLNASSGLLLRPASRLSCEGPQAQPNNTRATRSCPNPLKMAKYMRPVAAMTAE